MERFVCSKLSTKDNKDGLVVLNLKGKPSDIPSDIKHGAYGDRYLITVEFEGDEHKFEAVRFSTDDDGKGHISLKLAALPTQVGDTILYAPNGSVFGISYEHQVTQSDILPFKPEHRQATLRRLQVILTEPAFWDFMERYDSWKLLKDTFIIPEHRQDATLEVLYRVVGCHSRTEIVSNAAVCERTERLIREFRREQWKTAKQIPLQDPAPQNG